MKKLFTFFASLLLTATVLAQTTIFDVTGTLPSGWVGTNNVTTNPIVMTAGGGYFLVEASSATTKDVIVTSTYDLTGYTSATFTANVATYGSGSNNPATVQFSSDNGATWTSAQTTATPTSATYIASGPITPPPGFVYNNQFKIRISHGGTANKGVRLQDLKLVAGSSSVASGLQLNAVDTRYTIDFDNTADGSNVGAFAGSVWNTSNATGSLNSDAWYQNENNATATPVFGGSYTNGNGLITPASNPTSGGFYATNFPTTNRALTLQPTGSSFAPGQVVLKMQNQTGVTMTDINIGFTAIVNNNAARSSAVQISYSTDGVNFINVGPALTTPLAATPAPFNVQKHYFSNELSGMNVADGGHVYLRWSYADNGGTGTRDELSIDDIDVVVNSVTTTPLMRADTYVAVGIAGDATTQGNSTIVGGLGMINGNLNTSASSVPTVLATATLLGGSSSSFINGPINVQRNNTDGLIIPVGKNPIFSPVTLQPTTTSLTTYQVEYLTGTPPFAGTRTAPLTGVSDVEYWNISQLAGSAPANISYGWGPHSAIIDETTVTGAHLNSATSSWEQAAGSVSGTASSGTISLPGVTSFGLFGIGFYDPTPVPVQLLSFVGKLENNNKATLTWKSTCEAAMSHYELQRSENGGAFVNVANIAANNSGCAVTKTYSSVDAGLAEGTQFTYRLRMVDLDGHFTYSNNILLQTVKGNQAPYIAGNPVRNTLQVANVNAGDIIRIANVEGRILMSFRASGTTSVNNVSVLAPGTYVVNISGKANATLKMIKQ